MGTKPVDWREGFGTLPESEAEELEALARGSRRQLGGGIEARQQGVLDALAVVGENSDNTA